MLGPNGIAGVDHVLMAGDPFAFAGRQVDCIHTPGHTSDMLNFHIADEGLLFTGDTLFVMGCGRLFEGTPQQMWKSLQKLAKLPPETKIYCGHEYTLANVEFALSVDPGNETLKARADEMKKLRDAGEPTVPTTLAKELETNPFLRPGDPEIRSELKMPDASDAEIFAALRERKDKF